MNTRKCPNSNHKLAYSPIRICPFCGELLNHLIPENGCSAASHADKCKQLDTYCSDCGEYLLSQMHG